MTYALFEENGSFKAGLILQDQSTSLQIEHASGKRSKVKSAQVLLRFAAPQPELLMQQAQQLADDMDSAFVWECAGQTDISALALSHDYFGGQANPVQQAAMLLKLQSDPVYFHRRGGGQYRPAPPDILQAALAAVAKRQVQQALQDSYVSQMLGGELPAPIQANAKNLLWQPDKQSLEWKALESASKASHQTPERLLIGLGAFSDAYALHVGRFLHEHYPKGSDIAPLSPPPAWTLRDLPLATVEAYSIDDISTTEIDDALSFSELPDGHWQIGVHIAAPALGFAPGDALDAIARERMSTVYLPGDKIPMQPSAVIEQFSLDAGETRPVLSLYVTVDPHNDFAIFDEQSRVERIVIQENLRHNLIGASVNRGLAGDPAAQDFPYAATLQPLWRFAQILSARRDATRGKPEGPNRIEYQFTIQGSLDDAAHARVEITPRERHAPLDRLVAEYMILANQTWGALLKAHHLPGIYRSQQAGKPRMSVHALPHESIGVAQYAWCTSPLRRYVDLVNQWQIIAALDHGISAPLVAPFKPKDATLFAIIAAFEAKYVAYQAFQSQMERYWCLRWLRQEQATEMDAEVLKEGLVRFSRLPLVAKVSGLLSPTRGSKVRIGIEAIDEIAVELSCKILDEPQMDTPAAWFSEVEPGSVEYPPPDVPTPPPA